MRVLPSGNRAFLIEVDSLPEVLALYRSMQADRPNGVVDLVPAARTVLVTCDAAVLDLAEARRWALARGTAMHHDGGTPSIPSDSREVVVDVDYSGPDLETVARTLGMGVEEVVSLHTSSVWTAAFSGFAPGFAYLVTDHDALTVPRRSTPRTSVPSGAVGLAGEFSGIYPRESPGGWQLIGVTAATLWDGSAEHPALVKPGSIVRFRAL